MLLCAEKEGEFDLGNFDWGGNLIVHQVDNSPSGELLIKPVDEVLDIFKTEVGYQGIPTNISTSKNFEMYRGESLSKNITRISFDVTPKSSKGLLGIGLVGLTNTTFQDMVITNTNLAQANGDIKKQFPIRIYRTWNTKLYFFNVIQNKFESISTLSDKDLW